MLPVSAQKAIKAKQDGKAFILSMSQFDQNYDWYCDTCRRLEGSSLKSLTLNFDTKSTFKRKKTITTP